MKFDEEIVESRNSTLRKHWTRPHLLGLHLKRNTFSSGKNDSNTNNDTNTSFNTNMNTATNRSSGSGYGDINNNGNSNINSRSNSNSIFKLAKAIHFKKEKREKEKENLNVNVVPENLTRHLTHAYNDPDNSKSRTKNFPVFSSSPSNPEAVPSVNCYHHKCNCNKFSL